MGWSFRLNNHYLYITFDEKLLSENCYNKISNTTLAIDQNPNFIGLSIVNHNNKCIYREVINLKNLMCKHNEYRNKKKYELCQIVQHIVGLVKHYHVEYVGVEKLSIKPKDNSIGKTFNKMINNDWNRIVFVNNLKKHLSLISCGFQEIQAEYSSTIGCCTYPEETDSVAASLELNRRLRLFLDIYVKKIKEKETVIFPVFNTEKLTRWKDDISLNGIRDWKGLHLFLKKSKSSYRFLYESWVKSYSSLSYKSKQSLVYHTCLYDKICLCL